MRKIFYSVLFVGALMCQRIETDERSVSYLYRCENEEVICYLYAAILAGDAGAGGMSCKFKELDK